MIRRMRPMAIMLAGLAAAPLAGGTIEAVDLELGRDRTIVAGPIYAPQEGFKVEIGRFASEFDFAQRVVDDFGASGTRDLLNRSVDLGLIFGEELARQSRELGLPAGTGGWKVSGVVEDVLIKNREVPFGPLLFFGHVDLRLSILSPDGTPQSVRYSLHPTTARYNAGFGAKDENREAIAQVLIEAAQDTVARLNRQFFGLVAHSRAADKIADVRRMADDPETEPIRWLALSGSPDAIEPVRALARSSEEENIRAEAVEALVLLGATDAVPELRQRFSREDADVRYAILAAVAALDPEAGPSWVASVAAKDKSKACQHLALRLKGGVR